MRRETYSCDICGKVKGEANHWYIAVVDPGKYFALIPWDGDYNFFACGYASKEKHLCGQNCATKAMLKAMDQPAESAAEAVQNA